MPIHEATKRKERPLTPTEELWWQRAVANQQLWYTGTTTTTITNTTITNNRARGR